MAEGKMPVCHKDKLQQLLAEVDPSQTLEDGVAELLADMAHDFVDRVITMSCQLAQHRGSTTLEARDVQLHLDRAWDMRVPGFDQDEFLPPVARTDVHAKRLKAVSDAQKPAKRLKSKKDDMV